MNVAFWIILLVVLCIIVFAIAPFITIGIKMLFKLESIWEKKIEQMEEKSNEQVKED